MDKGMTFGSFCGLLAGSGFLDIRSGVALTSMDRVGRSQVNSLCSHLQITATYWQKDAEGINIILLASLDLGKCASITIPI